MRYALTLLLLLPASALAACDASSDAPSQGSPADSASDAAGDTAAAVDTRDATSQTAEPIDDETSQFVGVILAETEDVWSQLFKQAGADYPEPTLVMPTSSPPSISAPVDTGTSKGMTPPAAR